MKKTDFIKFLRWGLPILAILFVFLFIFIHPLHLHPHGEDGAGGLVGEVVAGGPLVEVEGAELDQGGAAAVGGGDLAGLVLGEAAAL